MRLFYIVSCFACMCAASDDLSKLPIKESQALFLSSAYLEEHPTFESLISAKILDDCSVLKKEHKKLGGINNIETSKRNINNGKFPLSKDVKSALVTMVSAHYGNAAAAFDFIGGYGEKFALHPLSVQDMQKMIVAKNMVEFNYEYHTKSLKVLADYCALEDEQQRS